jgi:hypothetical protein
MERTKNQENVKKYLKSIIEKVYNINGNGTKDVLK